MTDRIEEIYKQVMDGPDPLRRFADLVRQNERQALAQPEPTPDWEKLVRIETHRRYICSWEEDFHAANLRLTFDGETGKLKSAEVL